MNEIDKAKRELVKARNLLMSQRDATADEAAAATLQEAIKTINGKIQDLNQADLLAAAAICVGASQALEECLADARLQAFGGFTRLVEEQAKRLRGLITTPRGAVRAARPRAAPRAKAKAKAKARAKPGARAKTGRKR